MELKTQEPKPKTTLERNRNKRFLSSSPEESRKVITDLHSNEETKQDFKKNKTQSITSFLRPSTLKPNNRALPIKETIDIEEKN